MVGVATALSACLLFCVELWAGKMALPRFGGTAAVWTTSLMFFQTVLLLGYGYAHVLTTRLTPSLQRRVHSGVMAVAAVAVAGAVLFPAPFAPDPNPGVASVVVFLVRTVGVPFFLLSTTTPLLQVWWAQSRTDAFPWKYYAFSNVGSLVALVVYPVLVEPYVGLHRQERAGSGAFFLYAAMVTALAWGLKPLALSHQVTDKGAAPSLAQRLQWLGWSALASVLLGATHNVMCQDVAPTPLLWAVPLGVYLLSFVVTFSQTRWYQRVWVLPLFVTGAVWVTYLLFKLPAVPLWSQVAGFSLLQGAASIYCHGELFARRPAVPRLSEFYLWLSLGGALGAMAVSVVAPAVLDDYWEYPLSLMAITWVVATLLFKETKPRWAKPLVPLIGVMVTALLGVGFVEQRRERATSVRDFFGVLRVDSWGKPGDANHRYALRHGSITHGFQYTAPEKQLAPSSYFTAETGLGKAVELARQGSPEGLKVAVLGLGIGTTAALLDARDEVTFYDINPLVVQLAQGQGGYFTYLSKALAKTSVRLGDARLLLEEEARATPVLKDVLVVDVFSGDAIPAHLFTRESFEVYWQHLKPGGILALHVSNRHLLLGKVAFGLSEAMGLTAVLYENAGNEKSSASTWVLVAKEGERLASVQQTAGVYVMRHIKSTVVWTDDFHSLFSVMR